MGLELEWKYAATRQTQEQVAAAYPGAWTRTEMETAYYDTAAGDLAAMRVTLRLRLENGVPVATVKTPAAEHGRGEWECRAERIEDAVPILCQLGCPIDLAAICAPGLVHVCGARFTRRSRLVRAGDCTVELALDGGVLRGGGREAPLCEIEVERKDGTDAEAEAFSSAFAARFGLAPEKLSKFRRALALAKEE